MPNRARDRSEFDDVMDRIEDIERKQSDDGGSINLEAMGVKSRVTGRIAAAVMLPLVLFLGVAYMIRDHDLRNVERAAAIVAAQQDVAKRQDEMKDAVREVVYMLTLDEKERKAIRPDMPESLRKRMR